MPRKSGSARRAQRTTQAGTIGKRYLTGEIADRLMLCRLLEERGVEPGELKYGIPDIVYDIITTVGNLLQGEEKLKEYAGDAEKAGDSEAATAFRTVAEGNRAAAHTLLRRLKTHLADV